MIKPCKTNQTARGEITPWNSSMGKDWKCSVELLWNSVRYWGMGFHGIFSKTLSSVDFCVGLGHGIQ